MALIRRLLDGETVTHDGRFYAMHEAICEPRPLQQRLPIMIGGSGPTKTLRTTARHADLWNGFGSPARISATSDLLRERCEEIGRPFEAVERTVTVHAVIRDDPAAARDVWDVTARAHGIVAQVGTDGSDRGLSVGGSPRTVATYVDDYRTLDVAEVIVVFRAPFDLETIERLDEVREALGAIG